MAHGSIRRPRFTLSTSIIAFSIAAFGLGESPARAADGELDPRFGTGGIVHAPININAVVIQADRKIVAAGDVDGDIAVVRYASNGTLDPSFGTAGIVRTDLGGMDSARAIAIDDQQRILVGGTGLVRYAPSGVPDSSFGFGGAVANAQVEALAIRPDGTIATAGNRAVAYYDSAGRLKSTIELQAFGPFDSQINSYAILQGGDIVLAGWGLFFGPSKEFLVAVFDASGRLVFDEVPPRTTDFGGESEAFAVIQQPDGKLVAAGTARLPLSADGSENGFALTRYTTFIPGGQLDSSFGNTVVTSIPGCSPGCQTSAAHALALQQDGRIVAAGTSDGHIAIARYRIDGVLDSTFGDRGIVVTDPGVTLDRVSDLDIQPDGYILVAAGNILVRYSRTPQDPRLYYISRGSVQELASIEGKWQATDLRSNAEAPLAAGRSLAAFASAMESRVYYLDTGGNVQELARESDGGTPRWRTHSISLEANAPPAAPGSALAAIGSGPSLDPRVYYLDTAGMVQELAWFSDDGGVTPARWHVRSVGEEAGMPPASAGSALAAFGYGPQREPRVYYIDQLGLVQELAWFSNDGGVMPPYWHLRTISEEAHKPPAALDSTLTVTHPLDTPRVYYVTGVGDVKELAWRAAPNLWYGEVVGDAVTNSGIATFGETVYSILPNGVIEEAHIVREPLFSRPLTSTIDPLSLAIPTERADAVQGSGMVWLEDSLYYISSPSGIITRLRSASDVVPFGTLLAPADLGSPLVGFTVPAP